MKADDVKHQLDTHEAVCAERWKETLFVDWQWSRR